MAAHLLLSKPTGYVIALYKLETLYKYQVLTHRFFFKIISNWSKLLPSDMPGFCISEMFSFIYRVIYFAIHSLFMTLHHAEMHFLDCLQSYPGVINVLLHFVDWKMSCVNEQSREGRQRGKRGKETQVHKKEGREQKAPEHGGKKHICLHDIASKWCL